ncbi:MAG TPA: helix-turn-helix domain-containing protein [Thermotogota bacterium]|nr:helix-turn-helix domain-containing protein [Thermotogota bacterium]HRW91423.1 helix-turn-helix domain-containing protein [Thermotogota bacterium]
MNIQPWTELATLLKNRRAFFHLSEEQVMERANVTPETLQQLENGYFDKIPEIYGKEILQRYALLLQLSSETVLKKYLDGLGVFREISATTNSSTGSLSGIRPLRVMIYLLVPVLSIILLLQVWAINDLQKKQRPRIQNPNSISVEIKINGKDVIIEPNQSKVLEPAETWSIQNPGLQMLKIEYGFQEWEIHFFQFEVRLRNG